MNSLWKTNGLLLI